MIIYEPIQGMDAILARLAPGRVSYGAVEAQANARLNQLMIQRTALLAAMRSDGVPPDHQHRLSVSLQEIEEELKAS